MRGALKENRWYRGRDGTYRKTVTVPKDAQYVEYMKAGESIYDDLHECKVSTFRSWAEVEVRAAEANPRVRR